MKQKLTAKTVEHLPAPAAGRAEYFDLALPGFGVRVTSTGVKTFFLFYRQHGRQRRLSLGRYNPPVVTLASARTHAEEALRAVERGQDPADEAAARKAAGGVTLADLIARRHPNDCRPRKDLERNCKDWLKRRADSITRREARDLLDGIVARGAPVGANRVRAYGLALYNWAIERELVDVNPFNKIPKPTDEESRDRILTDAELGRIWRAAERIGYPFGPYVKTLILTAQRRTETAGMLRTDLSPGGDLWLLRASQTKTRKPHVVPLSTLAVDVLRECPTFTDPPLVFMSSHGQAMRGWSTYKNRLEDGVPDWTLHDLRRTAASGMAMLGHAPHVIEKILNHKNGSIKGVAAVYNRHDYSGEMRAALQAWGDHVERVVTGNTPE